MCCLFFTSMRMRGIQNVRTETTNIANKILDILSGSSFTHTHARTQRVRLNIPKSTVSHVWLFEVFSHPLIWNIWLHCNTVTKRGGSGATTSKWRKILNNESIDCVLTMILSFDTAYRFCYKFKPLTVNQVWEHDFAEGLCIYVCWLCVLFKLQVVESNWYTDLQTDTEDIYCAVLQ